MYKKIITILTLLTSLNGMSESITDKALDELTKVVKINNLIGKERKKVENNLTTFDELSANLPALYPNGFKGTERGSSCPAILLGEGDYRIKKNYRYYHSRDCMTVYVAPPKTVASIREFESFDKYENSCTSFNKEAEAFLMSLDTIEKDKQSMARVKEKLDKLVGSNNADPNELARLEKQLHSRQQWLEKSRENKKYHSEELAKYYHHFGAKVSFNMDFSVSDSDLAQLNSLNDNQQILDEAGAIVVKNYKPRFQRLPVTSEVVYRYEGQLKYDETGKAIKIKDFADKRNPILSVYIAGQEQAIDKRTLTVSKSIGDSQTSGLITLSKGGVCEYLTTGEKNIFENAITVFHNANLFSTHAYVAEYDTKKLSGSVAEHISKTSGPNNNSSQTDRDTLFVSDVMSNFMFSFYAEADNYIELIKSTNCDGYSDNKANEDVDKVCSIKDIMLTTQANMYNQYLKELEMAGKIEFVEEAKVKQAVKAPYVIHIPTRYCRRNIFRKKCRTKMVAVVKYEAVQHGVTLAEYLNVGASFKEDYGVTTPFTKRISTIFTKNEGTNE